MYGVSFPYMHSFTISNETGGPKKDVKSSYTVCLLKTKPVFPSVCIASYESVLCDWKMTTLIACKQSAAAEGFLIMR